MAIVGCSTETKSGFVTADDTDETVVVKPDPLNLMAIGVPGFDDEIAKQWAAQRDGDLNISHVSLEQFLESPKLTKDTDLLVHPASILAELVSNDLIRVFPREALKAPEMSLDSCLPHFRRSLVRHADQTWSVSLGGHQLRLFYRTDILESAGIKPPGTWGELNRSIEKLKTADAAKDMLPIVIPTSEEVAVQVYLARVASQIRDRGKLTSFFDRRTMKPTIEAAVFAQALEDLKMYHQFSGESFTVGEAFKTFADGKAVFVIGWPVFDDDANSESLEQESANWGVSRLPGSARNFDLKDLVWRDRRSDADPKVDLMGIAANNISIAKATSHAKDAVELVTWMTEKQNSQKLLPGAAAPFRATHLGRIGKWYSMQQADRKFLDDFVDSIEQTHGSRIVLMFPQIPGKHRYLKSLDDQIRTYLSDQNGDPQKLLGQVSAEWETLTEALGRETQIKELRRGNGF